VGVGVGVQITGVQITRVQIARIEVSGVQVACIEVTGIQVQIAIQVAVVPTPVTPDEVQHRRQGQVSTPHQEAGDVHDFER